MCFTSKIFNIPYYLTHTYHLLWLFKIISSNNKFSLIILTVNILSQHGHLILSLFSSILLTLITFCVYYCIKIFIVTSFTTKTSKVHILLTAKTLIFYFPHFNLTEYLYLAIVNLSLLFAKLLLKKFM